METPSFATLETFVKTVKVTTTANKLKSSHVVMLSGWQAGKLAYNNCQELSGCQKVSKLAVEPNRELKNDGNY